MQVQNIKKMSVFIQIVAWFTFINWQLYTESDKPEQRRWYYMYQQDLLCKPPAWLFGVAWTVLYALLTAFAVVLFGDYVAIFVLFFINILLNKLWSLVFFGMRRLWWAVAIAVGMLGTELAILILVGIADAWVPFGLFLPYVAWTVYALVLNAQFARLEKARPLRKMKVKAPDFSF